MEEKEQKTPLEYYIKYNIRYKKRIATFPNSLSLSLSPSD